jgi:putative transposase
VASDLIEKTVRGESETRSGLIPAEVSPAKWTYFYLYVMLDVFSRYVVRWMVADRESATHVSNDNPFSEAQFKTLKYRPAFPTRFGSIQDTRAHCHVFFPWYNTEHHHSGLGLLTPADVHHGLVARRLAARATVLTPADAAHPECFPGGRPHPPVRPAEVWINRPQTRAAQVLDRFLLADRDSDAARRIPR